MKKLTSLQQKLHAEVRVLKDGAVRLRELIAELDGGVTGAECSLAYDTLTDAIVKLERAADELG